MKFRVTFRPAFIVVLLMLWASSAQSLVITEMAIGPRSYMYFPNEEFRGLRVLNRATEYTLNDGSTWDSGAGFGTINSANLDYYFVDGGIINYVLDVAIGDTVYDNTDFNSGNHSAHGVLASLEPFVLRAKLGSTVASSSGSLLLVENTETWYGEPRFNYFAASVGSHVPFEVSYELTHGAVWDENVFDTQFSYIIDGKIVFASVPIPSMPYLFLIAFLSFCLARKTSQ